MIRPIAKEKPSIYHDSFYRYKKKRSPLIWLIVIIPAIVFAVLFINSSSASEFRQSSQTKQAILNELTSGQLLLGSASNAHSALLVNSDAKFDINGLVATVTLTQSFMNPNNSQLDGLYAFPLPDNAAVNYLHIQIADRIIEGKIMEKAQAVAAFQKAKKQGKKASLLEQHRANLFTNKIANIAPHEQITVTIKYFQHIHYADNTFSLRFPMTYTPRYQPRDASMTLSTPLPTFFSNKTKQAPGNISLNVSLNAGIELQTITSPSHAIKLTNIENSEQASSPFPASQITQVSVGNVQVPMDKDFILQWQATPSNEPRLSVFKEKKDNAIYALAMLIPPTQTNAYSIADFTEQAAQFPRDITFIIDTSGSMQGASIEQAKQSLFFALKTLAPTDSFNIIAFSSRFQQAFNSTVMANQANIYHAREFIHKLNASGGTQMYQPLAQALQMPSAAEQTAKAIKQIVFITDGAVSNELDLFRLLHQSRDIPRLFTVGIGAAPNGFFMRKAAEFGRGSYNYIGKVTEVKEKMSALLGKITQPVLKDIKLQFQPLHLGSIEQYPKKIPDLYQGEPLLITFKSALMPNSMQVFGEQANSPWHQEHSFAKQKQSLGITPIWAHAKIEDLLDSIVTGTPQEVVKQQVIATSLSHQVLSPYTSFIAIEQTQAQSDENTTNAKSKASNKKATPVPQTALDWQPSLYAGLLMLLISIVMQARRSIAISKKSSAANKGTL